MLEVVLSQPERVVPQPLGQLPAGQQLPVRVIDFRLPVPAVQRRRPASPASGISTPPNMNTPTRMLRTSPMLT